MGLAQVPWQEPQEHVWERIRRETDPGGWNVKFSLAKLTPMAAHPEFRI